MPTKNNVKTAWKAPTPPITLLTIAYFALNWDSCSGNVQWSGVGKYVNYAFRYTAIVCAVIYLVGYYFKKLTYLMRPMLYWLGIGILFGIIAGICFPLGVDITGGAVGQNSCAHNEVLPTTTVDPNAGVTTTESTNSNATDTSFFGFSSVYSFAIIRTFVCLVLWIFHYNNYVKKLNQREEEKAEEREAIKNVLPDDVSPA